MGLMSQNSRNTLHIATVCLTCPSERQQKIMYLIMVYFLNKTDLLACFIFFPKEVNKGEMKLKHVNAFLSGKQNTLQE